MNVHQLRQSGYVVKLRHVREFVAVRRSDDDCFMTRGEYINARENGELEFDGVGGMYYWCDMLNTKTPKIPSYGRAVSPVGGFTYVEITAPTGEVVTSQCSFKNRHFDRKFGTRVALQKAMFKLSDEHARRQLKRFVCNK